jgi:hypothetical protein
VPGLQSFAFAVGMAPLLALSAAIPPPVAVLPLAPACARALAFACRPMEKYTLRKIPEAFENYRIPSPVSPYLVCRS